LHVSDTELDRRLSEWRPPQPAGSRGSGWLYLQHVLQADQGCDFDFLRADYGRAEQPV
jgi:dihydroxyacid dehydratase/phosphogluconate dehydratase